MKLTRLLAAALLSLVLAFSPALATEINVIGYTQSGSISAVIDGQAMTVPDDMKNMHRQLIHELWEGQGHVIAAYVPPQPSTFPGDYPLQRYQFLAMLEITGLGGTIEGTIDKISDPVGRAIARARYESADVFRRYDPLVLSIGNAIELPTSQIDLLWMQAKDF